MRKSTTDLIKEVSKATGLPHKEVNAAIRAYAKVIMKSIIQGDEVVINSFGLFCRNVRKNRSAYDFKLKKRYIAPDKALPAFYAAPGFRAAVKDFYNDSNRG